MTADIRRAQPRDRAAISALLMDDALRRQRADPALWAVPDDGAARIAASFATMDAPMTGPVRHHWLVAHRPDGAIVGVIHGANLPAPPIFDLHCGNAGLIADDSHLPDDPALAGAMIAAAEAVLREAGAILFIATAPRDGTDRAPRFAAAGYAPTTLYLAKAGLAEARADPAVRRAGPADVDGIVALSTLHRAQLAAANPVFWNPHAEADLRFGAWMRASMDLPDRAMFVSGDGTAIDGFIVAQPGQQQHLAPVHDPARIGLVDDFHALAFEPGRVADPGHARALLAAAEGVFHGTGLDVALCICPVAMTAKRGLLESAGYRAATLWLVKADRPA